VDKKMLSFFAIIHGILNLRYNSHDAAVLGDISSAGFPEKKADTGIYTSGFSVRSIRTSMAVIYFLVIAFLIFKLLTSH
jgi:hypothetical protein